MKKKFKITLGILAPLAVVSVPIATSLAFGSNNGENHQWLFRGRIFDSKEDALRYLIQNKEKQHINIEDIKVVGNLAKSYANSEIGLLNDKVLPKFNPDNIHFAWKTAGGGITPDYEMAKNTYYNPGRVRTMFNDGFGHDFLSEMQAKRSMDQHKMPLDMALYQKVDFGGLIKKDYNPLSPDDLDNLKQSIKDNIVSILMNNVKDEDKGVPVSSYKVDFGNTDDTNNKNAWFDLARYIEYQNSKIWFDGSNHFVWNHSTSAPTHWYGPKKKIGGNGVNDDDKDWSMYANKKHDWEKTITAHVKNYGETWFSWYDKRIEDLSATELKNFINAEHSDWIKWDKDKGTKIENVYHDEQPFKKALNDIETKTNTNTISNYLKLSYNKIFKNDELLNGYSKFLVNKVKNNISNLKSRSSSLSYEINTSNFDKYYNLHVFGTWKLFHYKEWIETNETNNSQFPYKAIFKKPAYFLNNGEMNPSQSSTTLNHLLNWNDPSQPLQFNLKLNGKSMFDVTLHQDDQKGLVVSKIVVSENNNKGGEIFKVSDSPANGTPLKFMNTLYKEIQQKDKDGDEYNPNAVKVTMDKFFKDSQFDNKLLYSTSLQTGQTIINLNLLLKMQITNLKRIYDKNKDEPKLLNVIASKIIDPKKILIFQIENNLRPIHAKYRLTTMGYFNPMVSDGAFANTNSYALNDAEWQLLKSRDTKDIPAQILVAYDNNGQKVNAGGYKYDNEAVMEYNAKNVQTPQRDYDHVFVGDNRTEYVYNQIDVVQKLTIGQNVYYFKDFSYLKAYLLKYIENNWERI